MWLQPSNLHELIAGLLEKIEAIERQQSRLIYRQTRLEKTNDQTFDHLREAITRQYLDESIIREFIEESSKQFDEIDFRLKAIERRRWYHRLIGWLFGKQKNYDALITDEEIRHLKKELLTLKRHLNKLKEKKAAYGLESPVSVDIQIEDYEDKIGEIINKIESIQNE